MLAVQKLENFFEGMCKAVMTQKADTFEHAQSSWFQVVRILQLLFEGFRWFFVEDKTTSKDLSTLSTHDTKVEEFWLAALLLEPNALWETEVGKVRRQRVVVTLLRTVVQHSGLDSPLCQVA